MNSELWKRRRPEKKLISLAYTLSNNVLLHSTVRNRGAVCVESTRFAKSLDHKRLSQICVSLVVNPTMSAKELQITASYHWGRAIVPVRSRAVAKANSRHNATTRNFIMTQISGNFFFFTNDNPYRGVLFSYILFPFFLSRHPLNAAEWLNNIVIYSC